MRRTRQRASRTAEQGFALLLVFLMAASIAIMLYVQLPRVAFETEREREQLLIDRGKQYQRAIKLYYLKMRSYPSKIEDLENTNNIRFLRRRYVDPFTGKDDWRLVHINGMGVLTDSLNQKAPVPGAPGADGKQNASNTGSGTGQDSTGENNGPPEVNAAVLRRPSDRVLTATGPAGNVPGNPEQVDPTTGQPLAQQYVPPQQLPGQQYPGQPTYPGQPVQPGQAPQFPWQQYPGQQVPPQQVLSGVIQGTVTNPNQPFPTTGVSGQPYPDPNNPNVQYSPGANSNQPWVTGAIVPPNPNAVQPSPYPGQTPTPSQTGPAALGPAASTNPAINIINQILTSQRQPPLSAGGSMTAGQTGGITAGGGLGIAGVASSHKGPTIKIYDDHQKFQQWEFIFDLKSLMTGVGPQQGIQMGQPQQPGQSPLSPSNSIPNLLGPSTKR